MKNSGIPFFYSDRKSSELNPYWSNYVRKGGRTPQYMSSARRIQFEKRRASAHGNQYQTITQSYG